MGVDYESKTYFLSVYLHKSMASVKGSLIVPCTSNFLKSSGLARLKYICPRN